MHGLRILGLALFLAAASAATGACGGDESNGSGGSSSGGGDGGVEGPDGGPPPPTRAEFGLDARPTNATCKAPARPPSSAAVKFEQVYANINLAAPMMMAQRPGNGSKWYVALRDGRIMSFPSDGSAQPTQVVSVPTAAGLSINTNGEGGLLGFAFHPAFAQNGRLYVTWTTTGGPNGMRSVVGSLTSPDGGSTFGSYKTILSFDQTSASNHKGGGIAFGKDGLLYLGFGDGGGGDDSFTNGQTKTGFFAKVLRIDVDNPGGGKEYGIPGDNPFKSGGGAPEVFAYGFRNPFRLSIDRDSNQLWVADVGQDKYEEVDRVVAGGNYGWPCREGAHDHITTAQSASKCPSMVGLLDPVVEHAHGGGSRSITGGVVYRGKAIPAFVGNYVYGDYATQELHALSFDPSTGAAQSTKVNDPDPAASWVSFAEDVDGEVYAVALNQGDIYKLVAAGGATTMSAFPDRLSKTGCVDPKNPREVASGVVPYGVNSPLWSDGAKKDRFLAIPDGATIRVADDGDFDFPNGTVLMKTFTLGGKRVETRLFVKHDDGVWAGYTYEWLDDESDAVWLPSNKSKKVGAQTWYYPSRSECLACHTEAAGRSLGLELGQLNGEHVYPSTNRISNQLKTLDHVGLFAAPLGKPVDQIVAYPDPLGTGPLEARARSYLHANCQGCHRPGGPGLGDMDLRFGTTFAATKTCGAAPDGEDLGVTGAKRLVPGAPEKSLVSIRPRALVKGRMPPLASSVVDDSGLRTVDDWIKSLTACP